MEPSALKQAADAEAAKAEEEYEGLSADERDEITSKPGDQGSATQDREDPTYAPAEPSKDQLRLAKDVYGELKEAHDLGASLTIQKLISIVDTHPNLCSPADWPGEEEELYVEAPVLREIGVPLLKGCEKLELEIKGIAWLFVNRTKWKSHGKTVRGRSKGLDVRAQFLAGGKKAFVEINYHLFKTMNPRQKVATVYAYLRRLDREGKGIAPDFSGFFDELTHFGAHTYRETIALQQAVQDGMQLKLPFQMSVLEALGPEDEKG